MVSRYEAVYLSSIKSEVAPVKGLIICVLCLLLASLEGCSNLIYDYRDTTNEIIVLPNNYRIFKGNSDLHFIAKKQDYSPIAVDSDVYRIGWDEQYVLYKRKFAANSLELGLLDTKTGTATKLSLEQNVSDQLAYLKIKNIPLKDVNSLFDKKTA